MNARIAPIGWHRTVFVPLLLAGLWGCSAVLKQDDKPGENPAQVIEMMWPEPPLKTRIKFIGNLASEHNLKTGLSWKEDVLKFLAGGPPPVAQLVNPMGIAISADAQRVYVTDLPQARVFVFDLTNKSLTFWGREDTKVAAPMGIALDAQENVYVVDTYENVVRVLDRQGKPLRSFGHPSLQRITAIAIDQKRERVYVSDTCHQHLPDHKIRVFDLQGQYLKDLGKGKGFEPGYLMFPTYLAVDDDGLVYVADTLNARVQVFDPESGTVIRAIGERGNRFGQFERPKGIALDSFGNLYVVDSGWANVQIFNKRGQVLLFFGGRGRYPGLLYNPSAIAIDKNNRIYVANTQNFRLDMYQLVNTSAEDSMITLGDAPQKNVASAESDHTGNLKQGTAAN
jgi:DNA-binding beta-propeller fold protein YncE